MPNPLDEYPIHQAPLSMRYFATSDRNVYDRCIMQALRHDGAAHLATGLGVYPHAGVIDAYLAVRTGERMVALRTSGALGDNRMRQRVGPFAIEVEEPLQRVRVSCTATHRIGCELVFEGAFPAVDEEHHFRRRGDQVLLDAARFAQVGAWSGSVTIDGDEIAIGDGEWTGARDRSWGIRPVGDIPALGRWLHEPNGGSWWCWVPLRFEGFMVMLVLEEGPDGHRSVNDAVRVWPASSGRGVEQLGWPQVRIAYRPGTRYPTGATIELQPRGGAARLEIETLGPMPLTLGCGYGYSADPFAHGRWMGESWTDRVDFDLVEPATAARAFAGIIDHAARAVLTEGGRTHVGHGIFEHQVSGRHEPSGFVDGAAVAP